MNRSGEVGEQASEVPKLYAPLQGITSPAVLDMAESAFVIALGFSERNMRLTEGSTGTTPSQTVSSRVEKRMYQV